MNKTIYIVATPIGNLGDMSFRAIEVLKSVDCILAEDTRRARILLDHYGIKTTVMSLHKFNEREMLPKVAEILNESSKIALVSDAGTPLISDPGSLLIDYALNNQISIVPIPGPSALTTLLSVSGFSTLERHVTFVGFLPHTESAKKKQLSTLIEKGDVFVFFDSPNRINNTIRVLTELDPNSEIVIGRELTKIYEEVIKFKASSPPSQIKEKGEFTVAVKPFAKNLNKNKLITKDSENKSEVKKLANSLANYLNLQTKEAYNLLIKLKDDTSSK